MKKKLAIVFGILIIIGVIALDNMMLKKAVDQCVAGGHSYTYCKEGLR